MSKMYSASFVSLYMPWSCGNCWSVVEWVSVLVSGAGAVVVASASAGVAAAVVVSAAADVDAATVVSAAVVY
ncbi:unnamed protein product [Closterium sp. NIES-54]